MATTPRSPPHLPAVPSRTRGSYWTWAPAPLASALWKTQLQVGDLGSPRPLPGGSGVALRAAAVPAPPPNQRMCRILPIKRLHGVGRSEWCRPLLGLGLTSPMSSVEHQAVSSSTAELMLVHVCTWSRARSDKRGPSPQGRWCGLGSQPLWDGWASFRSLRVTRPEQPTVIVSSSHL